MLSQDLFEHVGRYNGFLVGAFVGLRPSLFEVYLISVCSIFGMAASPGDSKKEEKITKIEAFINEKLRKDLE